MLHFLFGLLLISVCAADKKFLYEDAPEVEDVGQLEKNDDKILLVEFYSPYCGHCIAFKPHYVEAAKALLAEHGDQIHVKAVSCAVHDQLCSAWAIRGVPSIFAVPPGVEPVKENAVALGQAELTWQKIMNSRLSSSPVVAKTPEETLAEAERSTKMNDGEATLMSEKLSQKPANLLSADGATKTDKATYDNTDDDGNVPDERVEPGKDTESDIRLVQPITGTEDDEDQSVDVPLPSQDDDDDLQNIPPPPKAGANLAKNRQRDMDQYKDQIKAKIQKQKATKKGVKGGGNKKVVSAKPVDEYEGATPTMKGNKVQTSEFIERKKKYVNYMKKQKAKNKKITFDAGPGVPLGKPAFQKDVTKAKLTERIPAVKRIIQMSAEEQLILDCTMAIWHGLTFNVFKKGGSLTPAKKKALTNWLDLLDVSLPPEWAIHSLIYDLRQNISFISERFENMKQVVDRYEIRRKYFSPTCGGTKNKTLAGKVGCGYWRLLHVISVGIAEHRGGLNLIDMEIRSVGTRTFSPEEAADTVRDYIFHFFYCDDCAESFLEDYDDCDKNRRCVRLSDDTYSASDEDWKEFALWFWEVHNALNVELVNEAADAQLKKRQKALLHRAPPGPGIASPETTIETLWPSTEDCLMCFNIDGTWNEAAVFRHIERTYWPDVDFDFDHMDSRLIWFEGDTPVNRGLMYILSMALVALFFTMKKTISSANVRRSSWLAKRNASCKPE